MDEVNYDALNTSFWENTEDGRRVFNCWQRTIIIGGVSEDIIDLLHIALEVKKFGGGAIDEFVHDSAKHQALVTFKEINGENMHTLISAQKLYLQSIKVSSVAKISLNFFIYIYWNYEDFFIFHIAILYLCHCNGCVYVCQLQL